MGCGVQRESRRLFFLFSKKRHIFYFTVFQFPGWNQRDMDNKGRTQKPTAVAVKPNFLKKNFKDLTLLLLGAEGKGKHSLATNNQDYSSETLLMEPEQERDVRRIKSYLIRTECFNGLFERVHEVHTDKARAQRDTKCHRRTLGVKIYV